MSLTAEYFDQAIKERVAALHVEVRDMSGGCGQAFACIIVLEAFEGKNKLARHRLVNSALRDELQLIHAFTQKAFTPLEWEQQRVNYDA